MQYKAIIIFLIALGIFFPPNSLAINNSSPMQAGKFYKIGNNTFNVVTFGNGPNVVFESGMGDSLLVWKKVAPSIAEHAHVILYDRAGIGQSHFGVPVKNPRTAEDAVHDLQMLLETLKIKPPYILVGHSLGGLYMQLFAKKYPNQVAGIVLIDSTSPLQTQNDPLPPKDSNYYPEAAGVSLSEKEVNEAGIFPNVPLIVLSATIHGSKTSIYNSKTNQELWAKFQENLSHLSSDSQQITANNTGHYIHKEKPWLVIAAIEEIIQQTKSH